MATLQAPTPLVILQSVAITTAAVAAGTNLSTSLVTLPSLLQSPSALLIKQWNTLYDNGLVLISSTSLTSTLSFAYLSYTSPSPSQAKVFGVASVAAFAMLPYTRILMPGINGRLQELGAKKESGREGEARDLVERWGRFNLVRGFLPLVGAVVGVWGVSLGY